MSSSPVKMSKTKGMKIPKYESKLDDNGESLIGSLAGKTSMLFPQIRRYVQVPMVAVGSTVGTVTVDGRVEQQYAVWRH